MFEQQRNPAAPGMVQTMGAAPAGLPQGFDWSAFQALDGRRDRRQFLHNFADENDMRFGQLRRMIHGHMGALSGQQPPASGPIAAPGVLPQQIAPQPGMVGTQLGVIGATPATSPFGLPTY